MPERYVGEATSLRVATPREENIDWRQGYGYQFWMSCSGFRGDGAFGQFCLVLPKQDSVVAMTGGTEAMQAVLNHVWERLLPGLGKRRLVDDAQPGLEQRLRNLSLAPVGGHPRPAGWEDSAPAPFVVTASSDGGSAARLTSIALATTDSGLRVRIDEPGNTLTFGAAYRRWAVSEPRDAHGDCVPVAASAGWLDDQTVEVQVTFLETPHRMDIVCSLPERTARASWRGAPLDGGKIETLHRPA